VRMQGPPRERLTLIAIQRMLIVETDWIDSNS
jgi:hypothetical protein